MSLQKRVLFFILLLLLLSFSFLVIATELFTEVDQNNNLRLGNDYIVIVVNKDENGQGRFAIETTGGAPFQPADDNKPLVYGRPKPWTSYTSIWLNGDYYVFGGETGRRAGATGKYGTVVQEPYVEKDSVITTGNINDILLVDQVLTIVKSSTTGLYDSVQIKYRIENISDKPQKIGLRIVLDTMLGKMMEHPSGSAMMLLLLILYIIRNSYPNSGRLLIVSVILQLLPRVPLLVQVLLHLIR